MYLSNRVNSFILKCGAFEMLKCNMKSCCLFFYIFVIENRGEFLEKLQRARSQVKTGSQSQPILSAPGATRLVVGNWSLFCKRDGEISIHNSDGQQVCV